MQLLLFLHPNSPQRFGRGQVRGIQWDETVIRDPSLEDEPLLHSVGLSDREDAHTDAV